MKVFMPFSRTSAKKNLRQLISSYYVLVKMWIVIRIVLMFIEEGEFWFDWSFQNWLLLLNEDTLKQPKTLLSIICKAFEYFWNILLNFYYDVSCFPELRENLSSNSYPHIVRFWSVSFIFAKPSILYFLFFFMSNRFIRVPGN